MNKLINCIGLVKLLFLFLIPILCEKLSMRNWSRLHVCLPFNQQQIVECSPALVDDLISFQAESLSRKHFCLSSRKPFLTIRFVETIDGRIGLQNSAEGSTTSSLQTEWSQSIPSCERHFLMNALIKN